MGQWRHAQNWFPRLPTRALIARSNPAATAISSTSAQASPSQGGEAPALWHLLPFSVLRETGAAVEVPVEVLGVEVVRVLEVVEGSNVTVLLLLSVLSEVVDEDF